MVKKMCLSKIGNTGINDTIAEKYPPQLSQMNWEYDVERIDISTDRESTLVIESENEPTKYLKNIEFYVLRENPEIHVSLLMEKKESLGVLTIYIHSLNGVSIIKEIYPYIESSSRERASRVYGNDPYTEYLFRLREIHVNNMYKMIKINIDYKELENYNDQETFNKYISKRIYGEISEYVRKVDILDLSKIVYKSENFKKKIRKDLFNFLSNNWNITGTWCEDIMLMPKMSFLVSSISESTNFFKINDIYYETHNDSTILDCEFESDICTLNVKMVVENPIDRHGNAKDNYNIHFKYINISIKSSFGKTVEIVMDECDHRNILTIVDRKKYDGVSVRHILRNGKTYITSLLKRNNTLGEVYGGDFLNYIKSNNHERINIYKNYHIDTILILDRNRVCEYIEQQNPETTTSRESELGNFEVRKIKKIKNISFKLLDEIFSDLDMIKKYRRLFSKKECWNFLLCSTKPKNSIRIEKNIDGIFAPYMFYKKKINRRDV